MGAGPLIVSFIVIVIIAVGSMVAFFQEQSLRAASYVI